MNGEQRSRAWHGCDPLEITKKLISMPTYGELGVEHDAITYLQQRFDAKGIPYRLAHRDGRAFNIVAEIGTGLRAIILNSHVDVVPPGDEDRWETPPFAPIVKGDRLFGRGSCDAKGSLASMVAAFERLWERNDTLPGRIILAAVGGEETGGAGVIHELKAGLRASAAIVGEPTCLQPKAAHKGRMSITVTVHGVPAHASSPRTGVNAIEKAVQLLPVLLEIDDELARRNHSLLGAGSLTVTRIQGGTAINVVPGRCTLDLDRRLLPGESIDGARSQIAQALQRAQTNDPDLRTTLETSEETSAAETSDRALVKAMVGVVEKVTDNPAAAGGFTATCDMTHLETLGGIPTIIYGPGDLGLAHQYNESVPVNELYVAAEVYYQMCLAWLARQ